MPKNQEEASKLVKNITALKQSSLHQNWEGFKMGANNNTYNNAAIVLKI